MRHPRALVTALVAVVTLSACSPGQVGQWLGWHAQDPAAADAFAADYLTQRAELTTGRPCPQWYDLALEQGWDPQQWPTVARVMYRESQCTPTAYNPSGASGLMQVVRSWADNCGGSPTDLFDPAFNLGCALYVLAVQGWGAWSTY